MKTTIINFSHPFTDEQLAVLKEQLGGDFEVKTVPSNIDFNKPETLVQQVADMLKAVEFTSEQWQKETFVLRCPPLADVTAITIAMVHALSGHFPAIVNIYKRGLVFVVNNLIDLQDVRNQKRTERF